MHLQNSSSLCRMQGCKQCGPLQSVLRFYRYSLSVLVSYQIAGSGSGSNKRVRINGRMGPMINPKLQTNLDCDLSTGGTTDLKL
jgi:hypothetical protein